MNHVFTILLQNPHMEKLEKLTIRAKPITDVSLLKLCENLDQMEQLGYLDLSLCDITNTGFIYLAEKLPYSNIRTLILSGNKIAPEAAKVILQWYAGIRPP